MSAEPSPHPRLRPLGALAPSAGGSDWPVASLGDLSGAVGHDLRPAVAAYLRSCPIILAWMEYTRDVISDRFGVAGGSAVASDGVYYWRVDAADYITEYGTAIPSEAIERMQSLSWEPPSLDRDQQIQIYQDLMALLEPPAW